MDIDLICFSQTGNTQKVATAMAGAFRDAGHSARLVSLKKANQEAALRCDLLGVGTPCHSGRAPTPVKAFLGSSRPLGGQQAFVFATSSGAPGRVLYDLTALLRNKGAAVLGGFLARGQVNHPAPHVTGQFRGRPGADDLTRARHFAEAVAVRAASGGPGPMPHSRPDALKPGWGLYDWMGLASSDTLLRLLMPEPKATPDRCDRCGWCADECPMDNISLPQIPANRARKEQARLRPPLPVFGSRCVRCYHCLSGCPRRALAANWQLADPFLLLLYNAIFMRIFGDVQRGERVY